MSVLVYNNGAWQDASETPKKYVNGAWEDSEGYAYENGVWVEKWSAFPSNYFVKDGIINPNAQYTITGATLQTGEQDWTYDATEKALKATRRTTNSNTYIRSFLRLDNVSAIMGDKTTCKVQYKVENGRYTSSNQSGIYIQAPRKSASAYAFYSQSKAIYSMPTTGSFCLNVSNDQVAFAFTKNGVFNTLTSAWIYNLWFE